MLKEQKGITLVALVITVIVLLILAGVAMSLITGEGGLFARANRAGYAYNDAAYTEQGKWNDLYSNTKEYYNAYAGTGAPNYDDNGEIVSGE